MNFPLVLANDRDLDVVGFGTNAVDFLIEVPVYPSFNSKIELNNYTQAAGGEIATSMVGLQRLGFKTAYVGRFGDDAAGEFGLESLRTEGVDVANCECIEGASTQIAFILIDADSGERTVIWKRDAKLAYAPEDAPNGLVARAKILHFTPHDADACIKLAREAKEFGTIVSIDLDNQFDKLEDLLPLVDVIITSAELPGRMFGIDDKRAALEFLSKRFEAKVVGITLGESGSLLLVNGTFVETGGFPVPGGCRDTTGAGDSFRAGLLAGLLSGASVERSAEMANAVASLKCRAIGARTSLPTPAELDSLLRFL